MTNSLGPQLVVMTDHVPWYKSRSPWAYVLIGTTMILVGLVLLAFDISGWGTAVGVGAAQIVYGGICFWSSPKESQSSSTSSP